MEGKTPDSPNSDIRHLAVILAADIVGYSRLMEQAERDTLNRLRDLQHNLIHPKVVEHRGRIFKTMGDGFLVEFTSVIDAVQCAVEIQRAMANRNLDLSDERKLQLRIGVNLGDIFHEGEDVFGDGVNIAARLEGLAQPGSIFVSRSVKEQIREKLNFDFQDLGEFQVKNITRPIQVFCVRLEGEPEIEAPKPMGTSGIDTVRRRSRHIWLARTTGIALVCFGGGLAAWHYNVLHFPSYHPAPWSTEDRRMSFAILPFQSTENDAVAADYSRALTEDLIASIRGRLISGDVLSSAKVDALSLKGAPEVIGRHLNVAFVVQGSVRRSADEFDTVATLTDVVTGKLLASERLREPTTADHDPKRDPLQVLTSSLVVRAVNEEFSRVKAIPDPDRDARDLTIIFAATPTPDTKEETDKMVRMEKRALAMAPGQPRVKYQLGQALVYRATLNWSDDKNADLQLAQSLFSDLLKEDSRDVMALRGMGEALFAQRRFSDVLAINDRIVAIDPSFRTNQIERAMVLLLLDRPSEALDVLERIPHRTDDSGNGQIQLAYGDAYLLLGRYPEAEARYHAVVASSSPERFKEPLESVTLLELAAIEALAGHDGAAKLTLSDFYVAQPTLHSINDVQRSLDLSLNSPGLQEKIFSGLRKAGMPE